MCGIAGTLGIEHERALKAVGAMCERMRPRGPDDGGTATLGERVPVVLGNRRLAIIDPSPAGRQPMSDPERGTTLVFNGMIYNFRELRRRLEADGERFVSDCDTEVVLRAYARWGPDCVRRLEGMFALAIWDEREQTLFLARDRLGIKPLYVVERGGQIAFASQVKALLVGRVVEPRLSVSAVRSFLAYGAVSEPLTAVEGVRALPPGSYATLHDGRLDVRTYWSPPETEPTPMPYAAAVEELRGLLTASVRRHLVSDAPLGIFLSGGLDSSVAAAIAAREAAQLRTVSVVFDDSELSEQPHMERIAAHVGSEHHFVRLEPSSLLGWLDDAFDAMDQPTFDGLNTYVVSRAAAETGLRVALSGLGADELFDGYGYVARMRALERARRLPASLTRAAAVAARAALRGERADKAVYWLRERPANGGSYDLLRRLFLEPEVERLVGPASANGSAGGCVLRRGADLYGETSRLHLSNYLRNVLLRDTDAMSMSRSLEVRVPYLDDRLVDWALRRHGSVKGERKHLLREIARELIPVDLLARPKQGFLLPLRSWMRRELAADVAKRIRRPPEAVSDIIDPVVADAVWRRYALDGRRWLRPWSLYTLSRWVESLPGESAA